MDRIGSVMALQQSENLEIVWFESSSGINGKNTLHLRICKVCNTVSETTNAPDHFRNSYEILYSKPMPFQEETMPVTIQDIQCILTQPRRSRSGHRQGDHVGTRAVRAWAVRPSPSASSR